MPGITRLRPGYSPVGVVDVHDFEDEDGDKPGPQYCVRCKDLFNVNSLLGPRVIHLDKITGEPMPKPLDHESWLECYGCGTVYAKYEVKQEPSITTLIDPDADPFDRERNIIQSVRERDGSSIALARRQQLNSIVDKDVKRELQSPGTELVSYEVSREY